MPRRIFVSSQADIRFDDAIALLAGDPERLIQDATDASAHQGMTAVGNLHLDLGGVPLGRDVTIELGEFEPVEVQRSVVPIRWKAMHGHAWFPTLDARLEIESLSIQPPLVRVALVGAYTPPLGPLGEAIDIVAARRIAETTTQTFVDEVAGRLEQLIGATTVDR